MSTIANCVYELTRLTDKYCDTVTKEGITEFIDEWRAQENQLIYRGGSHLSKEEHARRMISYRLGGSDSVMAARLGIRRRAFFDWRRKQGLPVKGNNYVKCDFIPEESV